MKKALLCLAFMLFLFNGHPFSVTCPRDGQPMYFDHQVGYGQNAVCWYSHQGCDQNGCSKHEAYVECGD